MECLAPYQLPCFGTWGSRYIPADLGIIGEMGTVGVRRKVARKHPAS